MKRYVVFSVNENPQYLFYLPIVIWAWRKFDWIPVVMHRGPKDELFYLMMRTCKFPGIVGLSEMEGYRSDTIAQVSRLYAACAIREKSYIMTSDADMLPLKDYWNPTEDEITVYGHDLTGYGHYPICYIGMSRDKWKEVMLLDSDDWNEMILRDLDAMGQAKSEDSVKRWVTDQDLITMRLGHFRKTMINRGVLANGYAYGRVDRSAWSPDHPELIDCHMLRDIYSNPDNLGRTLLLLNKVWPKEDFKWFVNYVELFNKVLKG